VSTPALVGREEARDEPPRRETQTAYETEHVKLPTLRGVDLIRELLDENQLPQRALVDIFGADSIVSEVLSGKRELQRKHVEGLAGFFNVSPAAFFPIPESRRPLFGQDELASTSRLVAAEEDYSRPRLTAMVTATPPNPGELP
jgi:hypothetical protein